MRYRSTRGGVEDCGFVDAVLMGLAPDRGLLVPKEIPKVDAATLEKWSQLPCAAPATGLAAGRRAGRLRRSPAHLLLAFHGLLSIRSIRQTVGCNTCTPKA